MHYNCFCHLRPSEPFSKIQCSCVAHYSVEKICIPFVFNVHDNPSTFTACSLPPTVRFHPVSSDQHSIRRITTKAKWLAALDNNNMLRWHVSLTFVQSFSCTSAFTRTFLSTSCRIVYVTATCVVMCTVQ